MANIRAIIFGENEDGEQGTRFFSCNFSDLFKKLEVFEASDMFYFDEKDVDFTIRLENEEDTVVLMADNAEDFAVLRTMMIKWHEENGFD